MGSRREVKGHMGSRREVKGHMSSQDRVLSRYQRALTAT